MKLIRPIRDSAGRRRYGLVLAWAVVWVLLCAGRSASAQPGPPGQTATDRVVQAHRKVQRAVIEVRYGVYYTRVDETEFVTTGYRLVFDRPSKRLRIDRPGFTLVSDGTDILLVAEALPGRHLRMPLEGELTYERLVEVFPDLADPTPPALVYLLSKDPISQFTGGQGGDASPLAPLNPAEADQTHLAFPLGQGSHKQSFNGASRLVEQVLIDINVNRQDLEAVRFHYAFDWSAVNKEVDNAEFELDLKQSHEMTTLAALLSPPGAGGGGPGGQGAGPGGAGGGGGSVIGMPLPDIELDVLGKDEKVKLSELDKGVVVLEFFASWSKASVLDLPALADFKAWCKEHKHEVPIYAVAVGEQPDKMTQWMDALEKTAKKEIDLPVLMDPTTNAAMAMKLPTVPRTIIAVDGRVVEVYGGVKPTFLEDLKKNTPDWLEKVKEPEAGAE